MTQPIFPKELTLKFEGNDFIGNIYSDSDDCAITRATKRTLGIDKVDTGGFKMDILNDSDAIIAQYDIGFKDEDIIRNWDVYQTQAMTGTFEPFEITLNLSWQKFSN